ncbi:glycosyltransferase family 2 protein [Halobaculum marinum]|uniref:Glycosyltransferase family 2 protein n=1 Tax=Halobaculum marinum TaxID=3031996 RepID=A0ABD5WX52_9EURY|nr:glycosyltransferase family 2 protein [Halobaculum sp. DT55]
MFRGHTVAVVLPAHDEAAFVGDVLSAIPPCVDRVYLVDDASTDDTATVALDAADPTTDSRLPVDPAERPAANDAASATAAARVLDRRTMSTDRRGRLRVLRHGANRGAGGAVVTGYLAALADRVDLVATVDADGQMDPTHLTRLLDPLVEGTAAYAKGTRLRRRADRAAFPVVRLVGNALLTGLSRVATGYWSLSDPVNGFTAMTGRALAAVDPASTYEGYGYGIDVLARLRAADEAVIDVPHPSAYGDESSGIDLTTYVPRVSRLLAVSFLGRIRREHLSSRLDRSTPVDAGRWTLAGAATGIRSLVGVLGGAGSGGDRP